MIWTKTIFFRYKSFPLQKKSLNFEKFEKAAQEAAKKSEKIAALKASLDRAKEDMEFYSMLENGMDVPEGCQSFKSV